MGMGRGDGKKEGGEGGERRDGEDRGDGDGKEDATRKESANTETAFTVHILKLPVAHQRYTEAL